MEIRNYQYISIGVAIGAAVTFGVIFLRNQIESSKK